MKNVKNIPDLNRMLILVRSFDEEQCHVEFINHQWKLTKVKLVVSLYPKLRTLYTVEASTDGVTLKVEDTEASTI